MAGKILILTPQTPFPPDQGAPIRNYNFIRYLGNTGKYNLTLLTFARPDEDAAIQKAAIAELSKYCQRVEIVPAPTPRSKLKRLRAMALDLRPDLALRLASSNFTKKLRQLVFETRPDTLLCEALELTPFVLELFSEPLSFRPRLILDEHNAEYLLQQRAFESDSRAGLRRWPTAAYSFIQTRRLRRYEKASLKFFDAAIAVSPDDKTALERLKPLRPITIIPNGIDLQEFTPDESVAERLDQLVFTGSMDFRPNVDAVVWFAQKVWPLIRREKPNASFYIVGRRPAPIVLALASLPGIVVTGKVLDTRPYVRESALYVVPMRMGGGVRFKVLEALAQGKAVLTTPMGADGITLVAGRDAAIANSPAEFANEAIRLLNDPARRHEIAHKGRQFVSENYDWRKITPLLDEVL